jgi:hypothetical protein
MRADAASTEATSVIVIVILRRKVTIIPAENARSRATKNCEQKHRVRQYTHTPDNERSRSHRHQINTDVSADESER